MCTTPIPAIDGLRQTFGLFHDRTIPNIVTSGAMLTALAPDRLNWKTAKEVCSKASHTTS